MHIFLIKIPEVIDLKIQKSKNFFLKLLTKSFLTILTNCIN